MDRIRPKRYVHPARRILNFIASSLLFMGVVSGCTDDGRKTSGHSSEDPVTIMFAPLGTGITIDDPANVTDPESKVSEFRIIAFDSSTEWLVLNEWFDFTSDYENPIELKIASGTYDFVFLANENSDAALASKLASMTVGATSLTDLEDYSFSSAALATGVNIPMSAVCYEVIIPQADNGVSLDGGVTFIPADQSNPWEVEIERLAVRVDVHLITSLFAVADDFSGVTFGRIPDKVFILEKDRNGSDLYNNTGSNYESSPRSLGSADGDAGFTTGMVLNGGSYEWKKSGVILPSSMFQDKTDQNKGVLVTARQAAGQDQTTVIGPLTHTPDNIDRGYNLPRNYHVKLTGSLNPQLDIQLDIQAWKEGLDEDISIGPGYRLSLSQGSIKLPHTAPVATLVITTDYPGGWTAEVSSNPLTVVTSSSLELSPDQGVSGATDVVLTRPSSVSNDTTVYIHITAGNLTAIVQVSMPATAGAT